jgi:hypothetical protein
VRPTHTFAYVSFAVDADITIFALAGNVISPVGCPPALFLEWRTASVVTLVFTMSMVVTLVRHWSTLVHHWSTGPQVDFAVHSGVSYKTYAVGVPCFVVVMVDTAIAIIAAD